MYIRTSQWSLTRLRHARLLLHIASAYATTAMTLLSTSSTASTATTTKTRAAVAQRLPVVESDLRESFIRGGGSGGQAVAKTSNCVQLLHIPTGTRVRCHATRSLATNRRLARRELELRLDELLRGAESDRATRGAVAQKKARRRAAKARSRHAVIAARNSPPPAGEAESGTHAAPTGGII